MAQQFPPGPDYNFFERLKLLQRIDHNPLDVFEEWARDYGDIAHLSFMDSDIYFVHHPDHIRQALVEQAEKFHKDSTYKDPNTGMAKFLGNGLVVSDGEFWKRQRRMIQPALHVRRIESYAQLMVDYTLQMLADWETNIVRDIDQEMMRLTLFIVAKSLFDADVRGEAERIGSAMTVMQHMSSRPSRLPAWIPTPTRVREKRAVRDLDEIVYGMIHERRTSKEDHGDLLSMLLMAVDEHETAEQRMMTDKQVRDEAVTMFLAGHETTSNALTWTFYLLSQNPEVEAKLHQQLDTVLAGRTPAMEDLKRLLYTEMVIKESMRLYPPVFAFSRDAIEDATIGDYVVKKGSNLNFISYITHRDPRWWDEPLKFMPERFSPENEKRIHKYAYLPFGVGPRICVGNMFAMMEAQLILATIAQRYRLELVPGHKVEPEALITMRSRYGMRMIPTVRQPVLERA